MLRVVIVDDEPLMVEGMVQMVDWEANGAKVVGTAHSGDEALVLVEKEKPDLIFTDIEMPGMDGLDFLEAIKPISPDSLLFLFSAHTDFHYAKRALKLGVLDYLVKPVTVPMIEDALDRAFVQERKLEQKGGGRPEKANHQAIRKALAFIAERYNHDITIEHVAEHIGMNASYFSTLFKKEMGVSYIKYVTKYRMGIAKQLLLMGEKVMDVSEKVGYQSYRHFSETFKKQYQITPSELKTKGRTE
ncbi:response regulator transcription factor [Shouchella rhizosphaerae]|uniref:response regulator transcription factor n=1 Tax=Shouchella rhizosphaerae TaxID=866786 RepID=UPI003F7FA533